MTSRFPERTLPTELTGPLVSAVNNLLIYKRVNELSSWISLVPTLFSMGRANLKGTDSSRFGTKLGTTT